MTNTEFDRQVATYVAAGFGSAEDFEELRDSFDKAKAGDLPPTIVVTAAMVGEAKLVEAIDRDDGKPQTVIRAEDLSEYSPREGLEIPDANAYVISGVSREVTTRNVSPVEAMGRIANAGRTPLTIEEGLAIWRLHGDAIAPNDGLSMAGSTRGDKRVPAIWISKGEPKLGWCFAGVPHTWLATASCSGRVAAVN